jgi:hypothetical protein
MVLSGQVAAPPVFLRLAVHPLRWRLLTELASSDYRVRELVTLVDQPQSLVLNRSGFRGGWVYTLEGSGVGVGSGV